MTWVPLSKNNVDIIFLFLKRFLKRFLKQFCFVLFLLFSNSPTKSLEETSACLPVNWTAKENYKNSKDLT